MNGFRLHALIFSLALLLVPPGIAFSQDAATGGAQMQPSGTGAAASDSQPQLAERYPRYAIQREDVLLVQFPLSPELSQTVTVQPDGFIDLQSAGSIHIQGLTVPQTIEAIKHAYTGILHDPIVNVDLEDFQKPFFSVTGQVGKPGQYELRSDITVTEAIAVAGGLAPQQGSRRSCSTGPMLSGTT